MKNSLVVLLNLVKHVYFVTFQPDFLFSLSFKLNYVGFIWT